MVRFLALLIAYCAIATPIQGAETRAYFKDWLAACRDNGYCSATAYVNPNPPSGTVADYVLRIGRHAQAPYWEISLSTVATMPSARPSFDLTIDDGQPTAFSMPYGTGAFGALNDFYFIGSDAEGLIDQLVAGDQVSFDFVTQAGEDEKATFSLSGLAASLLWIDEQQRRIGSERVAFASPQGLAPVSSDNPTNPPSNLLRAHAADENCEPFEVLPHAHDSIEAKLDDQTWLWMLPCTAGAYNFFFKAYIGARDQNWYSPLIFGEYVSSLGWIGTEMIVNPNWDEATLTLTSFYKGRGIADCGNRGTWQWTESGLRMIEFREKSDCDATGEPGDFPVVYSYGAD